MSDTQTPVVCFVHELGHRHVWWRLTHALPSWLRIAVVEQPPTGRLAPTDVVEHIEKAARIAWPGTGVDLVVSADSAAGAAAELVADASAAHALLINPDPQVLVGHPDYDVPAPGRGITEFLRAMAPYQEQLSEQGTLPEEGVAVMVRHSLGHHESLDEQDRRMIQDIAAERFTRAMPLDVSAAQDLPPSGAHDWFTRLSASPERFTVYSGQHVGLGPQVRSVLNRNVPGARLESTPTRTAFPWLEAPEALATLITGHFRA